MKRLFYFLAGLLVLVSTNTRADEGMWIPLLVERLNYVDMQEMGLNLTAEEIYSVNNSSLKDAIVIFGRGCTGEIVSPDGLLLTNHHCGEGVIQSHSSVEHDYLSNGFWAMDRQEELPNPGLSVSFLRSIEDVSARMLAVVEAGMEADEREAALRKEMGTIVREVTEGTHLEAEVKSFYYGNAYYLFIYEKYNDVRLVGAPPSSIGNFGGDTDNWVWPRHTGDFSLFRIYADEDNKPAAYSEDNVPYKPAYHFPISLKGVHEGDFTMVFGYPGTTMQYWPHHAFELTAEQRDPDRIMLRDKKLEGTFRQDLQDLQDGNTFCPVPDGRGNLT